MNLRVIVASFFILAGCVCLLAKSNVMADVVMADGKNLNNVEFNIPKSWEKQVKVAVGGEEMKLPAEEIERIVFWHKDSPEQQYVLVYKEEGKFDRKHNEIKGYGSKSWFTVEAVDEHLVWLVEYLKIKPSASKMTIQVATKPNHFLKAGTDIAVEIPDDNFLRVGKWLREFLADDSEIIKNITDKGYEDRRQAFRHGGNVYNPFLYELIVVDYTPNR